jgi:hypothetical protein
MSPLQDNMNSVTQDIKQSADIPYVVVTLLRPDGGVIMTPPMVKVRSQLHVVTSNAMVGRHNPLFVCCSVFR